MKTTGTLFLAFHDVRDALAAKTILSRRTNGVLGECLGEEKSADGTQAWLRCRFITAEELVEVSCFLALRVNKILLNTFIPVIGYWEFQFPCDN